MPEDDPIGAGDLEGLLRLAMSRPPEALRRARRLAASATDQGTLSYAHQAAGIVLRDSGEMAEALPELRAALGSARRSGSADREADVRATLGIAIVMDGRTRAGLGQLDRAVAGSKGPTSAKVLMRRAYALSYLGRHTDALDDIRAALPGIRSAGDTVWEARTLNNRGDIHLQLGSVSRAERDVVRAEQLFRAAGEDLEAVNILHDRGWIAYCKGDLPEALALYDEAAAGYARLGVASGVAATDLAMDRCVAFLTAGLTGEAVAIVRSALTPEGVQPRQIARLELMLARAALAGGSPEAALASARRAREIFVRQRVTGWEVRAGLVVVQARYASGTRSVGLLDAATDVAEQLEQMKADEAPLAWLMAGRIAAASDLPAAHELLESAARYRARGPGHMRATGWLARALDREVAGDRRGVFSACARGLDALDEHRTTLGSSELRALATLQGEDLADLALRHAVARGEPRSILRWSERWRATSLAQPPVRPPQDARLAAQLAALRLTTRRLDEARIAGAPTAVLEHERSHWEESIRKDQRHLAGGGPGREPFELDRLCARLGDDSAFVELVEVGGALHAVVVRRGRVRHLPVGPAEHAVQALVRARFALRQAARGRPTELAAIGQRLEDVLLGRVRHVLGDGAVVLSPPSSLHATPWGLLPALADRPVSVIPSAAVWLRARGTAAPEPSPSVVIAGPGLRTGGGEVRALAAQSPETIVLRDGTATVERALAALDGAALGHIAAHGHFRVDSPMFSSLVLDDGPLTVHDFERLRTAPYRLVMSACDSGVMAQVGANELLGIAAALLSLGTAGIVSSVCEVNDEATVPMMLDLHRDLGKGLGLDEALLNARAAARGSLLREATAASFVALGV